MSTHDDLKSLAEDLRSFGGEALETEEGSQANTWYASYRSGRRNAFNQAAAHVEDLVLNAPALSDLSVADVRARTIARLTRERDEARNDLAVNQNLAVHTEYAVRVDGGTGLRHTTPMLTEALAEAAASLYPHYRVVYRTVSFWKPVAE
jgi:hypothetical protein